MGGKESPVGRRYGSDYGVEKREEEAAEGGVGKRVGGFNLRVCNDNGSNSNAASLRLSSPLLLPNLILSYSLSRRSLISKFFLA